MRIFTAFICIVAVVSMLGGCKQQQSQQWGQGSAQSGAVVVPPSMIPSSDQIRQLETLARQNPKNKEAWISLGNAQMDSQRFADAIIAYQRALELDSKNVDVRVDMGTCYRGVGQPEKALEEYRKALKLKPKHLNANRNSGVVLAMDLHRNAEAVKFFERYLELAPGAADAGEIRQLVEKLKLMK